MHTEVKREEDSRRTEEDHSAPVGNGQDRELEQLSVSASAGRQAAIQSKVRQLHIYSTLCVFQPLRSILINTK